MEVIYENWYSSVQEFAKDLGNRIVKIESKGTTKEIKGVWPTFNDFKAGIEAEFNIEYKHTSIKYENEDGITKTIQSESDYFDAVKSIDYCKLYLSIDFDESRVKAKQEILEKTEEDLKKAQKKPVPVTQWVCSRCQNKNHPEIARCKICGTARKK